MERALFSALQAPPKGEDRQPFGYLASCYGRAMEEEHARPGAAEEVKGALQSMKELAASYGALCLSPELAQAFSEAGAHRGPLQLTDKLLEGEVPAGFLEDLAECADWDVLVGAADAAVTELLRHVQPMSILADFEPFLSAFCRMAKCKRFAEALVHGKNWDPEGVSSGRQLELRSLLGQFLKMSPIPDPIGSGRPDVMQECFSERALEVPSELESSRNLLRTKQVQLQDGIGAALLSLLRHGGESRERCLRVLSRFVDLNWERSKMQADMLQAGTHGASVNLCGVLLRLCGPFLDPASGKMSKIDPSYSYSSYARLDCLQHATRFAASESEIEEWRREEADGGDFHFISHCFWLTAVAMHIGVVKCVREAETHGQELHRQEQHLEELNSQGGDGGQDATSMERLRRTVASGKGFQASLEASLIETRLVADCVAFYRLSSAFLLSVANGGHGGAPLPEPPSRGFAAAPEFLIDDAATFLSFASHVAADRVSGERLDELFDVHVAVIGSPNHARNPHLRARAAELLYAWRPGAGRVPNGAKQLFEREGPAADHLVPNLIRLYVDIEHADSEFFQRFAVRHTLAGVLLALWQMPSHRERFRAMPNNHPSMHQRFLNMLLNDQIYLLDEALKKLPEIRRLESEATEGSSSASRELNRNQNAVRTQLALADSCSKLLELTSAELPEPFLAPEMADRVAGMLNYFLAALAGPQRRQLAVKDQEKYNFRPKQLLARLIAIYTNLARGGGENFAAAIARDERSYSDNLFKEASRISRQHALVTEADLQPFDHLASRAAEARQAQQALDEDLSDAPDEFLDPVTFTIMSDPVTLPSGVNIDRPTIQRHLLSDPKDPFSRQPLSADMLEANDSLRQRIQEWLQSKRQQRQNREVGGDIDLQGQGGKQVHAPYQHGEMQS